MRFPSRTELSAMSRLALPMVVAQVGLVAMGVVDTLMVGRVSALALASVALGNLYFFTLIVPSQGTLMVLDPVVAQAVGAHDHEAVARGVQRGMILVVLLGVIASLALLPVRPMLHLMHQAPETIPLATSYVLISIPGVFPYLGFVVLRQSLQAVGHVRELIVVIVAANIANAILNWVFVYGHLGSPALGAVGSAWATLVSRWLMFVALVVFGWPALRNSLRPIRRASFHLAPLGAMLHLGIPIGLQQFLEFAVFGAIGALMGVLGTNEMAAHQIAINLASLTFMVPVGVGAAAAVRVGRAAGARDSHAARESAAAAVVCGVGFMAVMGAILLMAPHLIAKLYTNERAVIALAAVLIPIAGVFQIFDGVQAVCAGVLRGLGDTRVPFVINLAGFWVAGFPVSVYLGFYTPLRAVGLWWGFVAGLGVVAALLLLRMQRLLRGEIKRTTIEADVLHYATDP